MLTHAPDVNVPLSQRIVHSRNPDFPQDDSAIAHESAAHLNEISLDRKVCELNVTEPSCAGPHLRFVLVPLMTRVNDFMLDLV